MSMEVRPATADDAGPASNVLRRSIEECCVVDHRGDAAVLQAWLRNKTPEKVRGWILGKDHHAVVALMDGSVVGFALSSKLGDVLLCYRTPEARSAGVGAAMLWVLEKQARADGVPCLRLESTRTARPFYLRNGFLDSGLPIEAFGMQSFPMVKPLTGAPFSPPAPP